MPENPLCPRVVYVCPSCGWWKPQSFECRHMVDGADGEPAFRDYRGERVSFELTWEPRLAAPPRKERD